MRTRKVLLEETGPLCKRLYKQVPFCEYCEWKGNTGPGAQLKTIIANMNKGG
jgi:hypothetical protein